MRTACPYWLLQIEQIGPEISQVFLCQGHELVHTALSVSITNEQKGNAACCILLLQRWFTSVYMWEYLHLLKMSERKTEKNPHILLKTLHILLLCLILYLLACTILQLFLLLYLFTDDTITDKNCYKQKKPLYLIM